MALWIQTQAQLQGDNTARGLSYLAIRPSFTSSAVKYMHHKPAVIKFPPNTFVVTVLWRTVPSQEKKNALQPLSLVPCHAQFHLTPPSKCRTSHLSCTAACQTRANGVRLTLQSPDVRWLAECTTRISHQRDYMERKVKNWHW